MAAELRPVRDAEWETSIDSANLRDRIAAFANVLAKSGHAVYGTALTCTFAVPSRSPAGQWDGNAPPMPITVGAQ